MPTQRSFWRGLIVAGLLLPSGPLPRLRGAEAPAPMVTRKTVFNIPFRTGESSAAAIVELYVSKDRGKDWKLYGKQPATGRSFQFQAQDPGEYWFASRLVSRGQPATRRQALVAELRVLIDLDEPKLEFESKVSPTGDVVSEWRVSDASLDATTFKIEYQTDPRKTWQKVPSRGQQSRAVDNYLIGKTSWVPAGAQQAVQVRAEISDRAGNKAVVNRVVLLPPSRNGDPTSSGQITTIPSDPFRHAQELAEQAVTWPKDNRLHDAATPQTPADLGQQFVHQIGPAPQNADLDQEDAPSGDSAVPYPKPSSLQDHQESPVVSRINGRPVAEPRSVAGPGLRPGERPRMTRSRQFQLDYSIESVGPTGLLKVELWGTSDFGETWSVWKLDDDRASPVDVAVEEEGVFGFRIVVVAKNGLAAAAPRNGDPAELWVGVDTTTPAVQIDSAAYGDARHFGQLDIRWTAADKWLSDRPITLLFGDQPTGPWTTIRAGLENSGQYYWPIDPRVPEKIYLKLEARDEAGNVGVAQVSEPINTGGLTPRAHIRGLRVAQ